MFFNLTFFLFLVTVFLVGVIDSPFLLSLTVLCLTGFSCGVISNFCFIWVAYAIFITYVGGMMVLFTYASSMSYSDKISGESKPLLLGGLAVCMVMLSMVPEKGEIQMTMLFHGKGLGLLGFITSYLLVCLFLSVKLVEVYRGSLIS